MLNKKGFTIAEVIVSFTLISIILASLIATMMYYRDKVKDEEVRTQLWDFKNTVTKVIYDDVINKQIVRVESCIGGIGEGGIGTGTCVNLIDKTGGIHTLRIDDVDTGDKQGVYLSYDGTKYMLPDSDLGAGVDRVCDFITGFEITSFGEQLYKIKTTFRHKDKDITHSIMIVIS